MVGFAQKLFLECTGNCFWKKEGHEIPPGWPLLQKMLEQRYLDFIDYSIAQQLLGEPCAANEPAGSFICHLSLATRQGHLCIKIEEGSIFPPPEDLWGVSEEADTSYSQRQYRNSIRFELLSFKAQLPLLRS